MKNEFAFVLVYVAAFGFSDIFVKWSRIDGWTKILYYSSLLFVALLVIFHSSIVII